jgi:hypothetical protein
VSVRENDGAGPLLLVNVRDFRMRRVVQRNLDSRNVGLGSFAGQRLAVVVGERLSGTYGDI